MCNYPINGTHIEWNKNNSNPRSKPSLHSLYHAPNSSQASSFQQTTNSSPINQPSRCCNNTNLGLRLLLLLSQFLVSELSVRQLSASETLVRGLLRHDATHTHLQRKPSSPQNPPRCTSSRCEQGGGDRLHITSLSNGLRHTRP